MYSGLLSKINNKNRLKESLNCAKKKSEPQNKLDDKLILNQTKLLISFLLKDSLFFSFQIHL